MLARLRFFKSRVPANEVYSTIHDVHASHRPSLLSGSLSGTLWRHDSVEKTLIKVTTASEYLDLQKSAMRNFERWKKLKAEINASFEPRVQVEYQDWGTATLNATKHQAVIYSVLNMANSRYPGGAVLEGGSAQEENMWHRSSCLLSLIDKIVTLDKQTNLFVYTEEGTALVEARKKMTQRERDILKERAPMVSGEAYKTLHSTEPRICFRGPEILLSSLMEEYGSSGQTASPELSYSFLPSDSIFPFYELRSAAPEHFAESQSQEPSVLKTHQEDLRRRIAAQLDTLILAGQSHAVLGAWGCGAFKNEPELVARTYAEEIEKRAEYFQHLLFPIINTNPQSNNFDVFENVLNGIKLGPSSTNSLKI
ncbi:poly(ADP-ribose) glycohydrolase domain-containing protein [Legionella sp. WA2022007384]